jgi:hypothetical protein
VEDTPVKKRKPGGKGDRIAGQRRRRDRVPFKLVKFGI